MTVKYNSDAVNAVTSAPGHRWRDGSVERQRRVVSFKAINFQADFADFVHIGGDFAFRKTTLVGPPATTRIEVVASNVSVSLSLSRSYGVGFGRQPGAVDQGRRQEALQAS